MERPRIPPFLRCTRTGNADWRCSEMVARGRSYCLRHYIEQKRRNQRKRDRKMSSSGGKKRKRAAWSSDEDRTGKRRKSRKPDLSEDDEEDSEEELLWRLIPPERGRRKGGEKNKHAASSSDEDRVGKMKMARRADWSEDEAELPLMRKADPRLGVWNTGETSGVPAKLREGFGGSAAAWPCVGKRSSQIRKGRGIGGEGAKLEIQSCIKVALDFVSPENVGECLRLVDDFRLLPKTHRAKQDKLEVKKMALYAVSAAVREATKLKSKIK